MIFEIFLIENVHILRDAPVMGGGGVLTKVTRCDMER